jgi:hypothetical protein
VSILKGNFKCVNKTPTIWSAITLVRLEVLTLAKLKIKIFWGCEIRFSTETSKTTNLTTQRYLQEDLNFCHYPCLFKLQCCLHNRHQTKRRGSVIIPLKEMVELTQTRWFGYAVRIGDERHPIIAWQARTQKKRPKGSFRQTWEKGMENIFNKRTSWQEQDCISRLWLLGSCMYSYILYTYW